MRMKTDEIFNERVNNCKTEGDRFIEHSYLFEGKKIPYRMKKLKGLS